MITKHNNNANEQNGSFKIRILHIDKSDHEIISRTSTDTAKLPVFVLG